MWVVCYFNDIIVDLWRHFSVRLDLFISCGHSTRHVVPCDSSSAELIVRSHCSLYTECSLKWNFVTRRICDNYLCCLFSICNWSFIVIYYVDKKYWDFLITRIIICECFAIHSVRCCNASASYTRFRNRRHKFDARFWRQFFVPIAYGTKKTGADLWRRN